VPLRQHDRIAKDWATWISLCIRLRSHRGMHSGTRRRCHARWFAEYTGRVLLDVHSHGAFGRAAHAQRRHPFHNDVLRQPDGRQKLQHHGALPRPPLNPQSAPSQPSWDRRASASMPSLQDRSQRAQHQGFPNLMHYSTRLRQRRRHAAWLALTTWAWPPPFLHMMRRGSSRGKRFMSTVAITSSINEPYGASLSADL
jgi:hypothetical protein